MGLLADWISDSEDETEIESVPKQREPSFVKSTEHVKTFKESVKKVEHNKQAENLRTNNQKSRAAKEVGQAQDDVSIPTEPSTSKPHKKHKSKKQQPIAPKFEITRVNGLCTRLSNKVLDLESEVIDIKYSFTYKIEKLKDIVHKLEEENRILKDKSFKSAKINDVAPVEDKEESFKQGRMIADMDEDDINEEEPAEVEEVLEVVTTAKLIIEVVTTGEPATTAAQVPKVSAPRRRRGVVIQDSEETTASGIMHIKQVKKGERQNNAVMRYQALKGKPLTEAQARKNMMIYLKNMDGFKMNFFKGMTYSEIKPMFEKHYNSNQAFLKKVEEEVIIQEKEIEEEGNKRQEATPLASKVPVIDYQIHHENNKLYYKIIRADGSHKLFLSFITLLKNFDREDLKTLWKLVKERGGTTEPKNFSDDFLLNILKIMFKKHNIEANVWKD
nr:hypothetical protein [Tanacetum cinerariifolium]